MKASAQRVRQGSRSCTGSIHMAGPFPQWPRWNSVGLWQSNQTYPSFANGLGSGPWAHPPHPAPRQPELRRSVMVASAMPPRGRRVPKSGCPFVGVTGRTTSIVFFWPGGGWGKNKSPTSNTPIVVTDGQNPCRANLKSCKGNHPSRVS